jgi:hypothetical protein
MCSTDLEKMLQKGSFELWVTLLFVIRYVFEFLFTVLFDCYFQIRLCIQFGTFFFLLQYSLHFTLELNNWSSHFVYKFNCFRVRISSTLHYKNIHRISKDLKYHGKSVNIRAANGSTSWKDRKRNWIFHNIWTFWPFSSIMESILKINWIYRNRYVS